MADPALNFEQVRQEERNEIHQLREGRLGADSGSPYVGLALSGGGIRSATFNMGVLQALAKQHRLDRFDYLSTVSGGGYIGSWLVAWIKRARGGFSEVNQQLNPDWIEHSGKEPAEIGFLRDYSNYLTPRAGFFTADTWTALITVVRNLLLNLSILIMAAIGVLLLPYWLVQLAPRFSGPKSLYVSLLLLLVALALAGWQLWPALAGGEDENCPRKTHGRTVAGIREAYAKTLGRIVARISAVCRKAQGRIVASICAPWFAGAYLASCWAYANGNFVCRVGIVAALCRHFGWCASQLWTAAEVVAGIVLLSWVIVGVGIAIRRTPPVWSAGGVLVCSLLSFLLLSSFAVLWVLFTLSRFLAEDLFPFQFITWGVPLMMVVYLLVAGLQVGLTGMLLRSQVREWQARLAAWVMISTIAWVALFAVAIYSPLGVVYLTEKVKYAGLIATLLWLFHTGSSLWSSFSPRSGAPGSRNWLDMLAVTGPFVFALGLFILLSYGIFHVAAGPCQSVDKPVSEATVEVFWNTASSRGSISTVQSGKPQPLLKTIAPRYFRLLADCLGNAGRFHSWNLFLCLLGFSLGAWLFSLRVDINEFSLHTAYRNRLVRCYLGASRPDEFGADPCRRQPSPFTGFDPQDDFYLAKLTNAPKASETCEKPYQGPYPILNATLNLTHGERLAWQERKAESFTFTPLFCGGTISDQDSFLPTRDYAYPPEGPYLGTAMAISGAAVSPLVGFHYSGAAGFLMAVFNARLGQWMANPRSTGLGPFAWLYWLDTKLRALLGSQPQPNSKSAALWNRYGPRVGGYWLIKELFGLMDDGAPYVYLSDGGHFENLGIYELVRRRCKVILACDASEDREYKFEGLGNAIRKCRDDFGVEIKINVDNLRPKDKSGQSGDDDIKKSGQHCAVGIISYDQVRPGAKPGILIYVKASLTGDEPTDVLEYKNSHPDFPHDSTADQWFSESQFESYRKLGEHIIDQCASVEHERQTMPVLDLLEMDQWNARTTSESLGDYLTQKLGGVYQPRE